MVDVDLNVGLGAGRRRRRSADERRRVVEETLVAGASVGRVALKHAVNANQVFQWRHLYWDGKLGVPLDGATKLLAVSVDDDDDIERPKLIEKAIRKELFSIRDNPAIALVQLQIGIQGELLTMKRRSVQPRNILGRNSRSGSRSGSTGSAPTCLWPMECFIYLVSLFGGGWRWKPVPGSSSFTTAPAMDAPVLSWPVPVIAP